MFNSLCFVKQMKNQVHLRIIIKIQWGIDNPLKQVQFANSKFSICIGITTRKFSTIPLINSYSLVLCYC